MTGAAREPDQADFDLERFIDMFDEALTSSDERVVNALRSLMMMVILTKSEAGNPMADRNAGPLRRLFDDMNHLNRRLHGVEEEMRSISNKLYDARREYTWEEKDKYTMKAATQLAQSIDQDIMRKLSAQTAMSINGGQIKGLK